MSTLKDFVEYTENVFFGEVQDVNGVKIATELFFENYRKNNFISSELITMLKAFHEKMKSEENEMDSDFLALLVGTFLGLSFGKYSKRILIDDRGLEEKN